MYKSIAVGFAFFTIATVLGALWAAEAWGGYWSWDPKETWALIVWLNYAAWLHEADEGPARHRVGLVGLVGWSSPLSPSLASTCSCRGCTATANCKTPPTTPKNRPRPTPPRFPPPPHTPPNPPPHPPPRGPPPPPPPPPHPPDPAPPPPTDSPTRAAPTVIQTNQHGLPHLVPGPPHPTRHHPPAAFSARRRPGEVAPTGAPGAAPGTPPRAAPARLAPRKPPPARPGPGGTDYKDATSYNNFYEFGTDKSDPAQNAHTLKTTPWTVEVEGLVKKPPGSMIEDLLKAGSRRKSASTACAASRAGRW